MYGAMKLDWSIKGIPPSVRKDVREIVGGNMNASYAKWYAFNHNREEITSGEFLGADEQDRLRFYEYYIELKYQDQGNSDGGIMHIIIVHNGGLIVLGDMDIYTAVHHTPTPYKAKVHQVLSMFVKSDAHRLGFTIDKLTVNVEKD
jgi:hypothetical protein